MQNLVKKSEQAELIKQKALESLYFFDKEILGYTDMTPRAHGELCQFVEDPTKKKKLILMPRNSFKSSVVTIGRTLQKLCQNPNHRVLIISETFNQAKKFLKEIKDHIEKNMVFRGFFGDLKPEGTDAIWRQEEIEISTKTRGKEASVVSVGVGQEQTGMHYPTVIMDDIVSQKNINTQEQIQKILDYYKLILSVLSPGGELIIIGTRYHYGDLYGHIIENELDTFSLFKRSAYMEDGSLFFPEILNEQFLNDQKKLQGTYHFSTQYCNEPVDQDTAVFKRTWIRYYNELPHPVRHFICVDPASSLTRSADFTAIIVAAVDTQKRIYIVEAIQMKGTVKEVTDKLFSLVEKYRVNEEGKVGLELNAMQLTLKYIFAEEMNNRNFYFQIDELRGGTSRTKPQRIRSLQPYFENGLIFLKKEQTELVEQLTRYPRTKHDDLCDALAYLPQIIFPATPIEKVKWEGSTLSPNERRIWDGAHDKIRRVQRFRKRI